ncbi:MAG: sulfatase-like hydrolase/transferase [Planctomycetes bacterium]|nr:sulfatase-like hydrolase/transferase [Planctomycetota bacterium]
MSRILPASPRALLVLLAGALGSCSRREPPVQAGTTLFDLLDQSRLEAYPETNLPPEIAAAAAEPFRMRGMEILPGEWTYGGDPPPPFAGSLPASATPRYWLSRPDLPLAAGADPPVVLRGGAAVRPWDPGKEPFPGEAVWWDQENGDLCALGPSPPERVQLEFLADPRLAFDLLEESLARPPGAPTPPRPRDLVRQIRIGAISRRCLLLPAPAALSTPAVDLRAESLHLAVAVVASSWRHEEGRIEASREGSDGVEFRVDVLEGGRVERVFSHSVPAERVGAGFENVVVDLTRFRGRRIALRLATEPGPGGDRRFDYAVVGALRFAGGESREFDRPHVILVDLDTLRPDRLGSHGYARATSPRLDAWAAANAVVHRDALSTSSWTLPATASMGTGLAVHQHGLLGFPGTIPSAAASVAERLRDAGYATYGVAEGGFLGGAFGFDRGFDLYHWGSTGSETDWRGFLPEIRRRGSGRPLFLFLHTYLVHSPYLPDSRFEDSARPYAGWLADRPIDFAGVIEPFLQGKLELGPEDRDHISRCYDAGIARMDSMLGEFLEEMEGAFRDRDFLLIVTADHGEELFEHGGMGHGQTLYGEVLRIPLIVRFPGEQGRARAGVEEAPVSILDIVPTILDYAGIPVPDDLPGTSLRTPPPAGRVRVAELAGAAALQRGRWKLILGRAPGPRRSGEPEELYDLEPDPGETRNLAREHPDVVRDLKEELDRFRTRHPPVEGAASPGGRLGVAELDRLRALGYLGEGR